MKSLVCNTSDTFKTDTLDAKSHLPDDGSSEGMSCSRGQNHTDLLCEGFHN